MPKAIVMRELGDPEVLTLENIKTPEPKPDEIIVKHTAIGINYIDTYHRTGLYPLPKLPAIPGTEGVGHIVALGSEVEGFREGDRIGYCTGPVGSYREERAIPAEIAIHIPNNISDEQAAAVLSKGMTAHYLLRRTYIVTPGQTILVHAAADGVGHILCQFAKQLGVKVIGTVNSDEKAQFIKENGCDYPINFKKEDFVERVREITNGEGVPVVYDAIGRDTFEDSIKCLFMFGTMVSFGYATGPVPPIDISLLSKKSLFLTCPKLMDYKRNRMELVMSANELFELLSEGLVKVYINKTYALEDAVQAHKDMDQRAHIGSNLFRL